ncbi:MAG: hypothetical protein H0U76_24535, partial [Ktedonobacteraceae bacterium]|nr:hypothetical protein [Ktedonobacteraceae bacterium]
ALGNTRVGQAVKRGYETVRNTMNKGKARVEQWQKDREAKQNAGKTPEEIAKEKQDKLDKAVAAIQPAVIGMLQKGAPSLLLNARLAFWRARYGLSSLSVENKQIIAKVNPEKMVAGVVPMNVQELLIYVRELKTELQKQARIQKKDPTGKDYVEAIHPSDRSAANPGEVDEFNVPAGAPMPSVLEALSRIPYRYMGAAEVIHFQGGTRADGSHSPDADVRRHQPRPLYAPPEPITAAQKDRRVRNKLVTEMNDGRMNRTAGLDYPSLVKRLNAMGHPAEVAGAVQSWIKNRTVPEGFEDPAAIAAFATLITVQEAHRSSSAMITAVTTLDVASRKGWDEAVKTFPMSPQNSQGAANSLDNHLTRWQKRQQQNTTRQQEWETRNAAWTAKGRSPLKSPQLTELAAGSVANDQMNREFESLELWVRVEIEAKRLVFADNASDEKKREDIKHHLRQRAYSAYGLTPPQS